MNIAMIISQDVYQTCIYMNIYIKTSSCTPRVCTIFICQLYLNYAGGEKSYIWPLKHNLNNLLKSYVLFSLTLNFNSRFFILNFFQLDFT